MSEAERQARCQAATWKQDGAWSRTVQCERNAKVERDGKHYCGQHDPATKKERDAKRAAKIEAGIARDRARHRYSHARETFAFAACDVAESDIPASLIPLWQKMMEAKRNAEPADV